MRIGSLEIQIMAGIARLQKDMNDAQRIVGGSMAHVEKSVAGAKRAMQALGIGLPLAMITDQVRRMTDQYTKLDAQLRLSTKSQAEYAQGMSDIRRISGIAQADISATSMLYTRLLNVMKGTNVEQSKLATVTETVAFGLKAYGATAQEASSAALQLSQAMGANRLGGEEFRAVMEAMPNVMKVLADSMGVPLGELRAMSIAGKITAEEMVKAFGDPAIAAQFKQLALNAQTITGAWIVARNELTLLIGEFMKASGVTGGLINVFKALTEVFRVMAQYMDQLVSLATVMAVLYGGKLLTGLVQARMAQMALNAAHVEALGTNLAMAQAEVARIARNAEVIVSERAKTVAQLQSANAAAIATAAVGTHSAALRANAVATKQASVATAELAALSRMQAANAAALTAATATLATAQEAAAAATLSTWGKLKSFATNNKLGLIGLAMWGAYEIADHLGWIDKIFNSADVRMKRLQQLAGNNPVFEEAMKFADERMTAAQASKDQLDAAKALGIDVSTLNTSLGLIKAVDAAIKDLQGSVSFGERTTELKRLRFLKEGLQAGLTARKEEIAARTKEEEEHLDWQRAGQAKLEADSLAQRKEAAEESAKVAKAAREADEKMVEESLDREYKVFMARRKATTEAELAAAEIVFENAARIEEMKAARDAKRGADMQKALDEETKAAQKQWELYDGYAHTAFDNVLDKGKNVFEEIGDAIKKYLLDMLYKLTVQKWMLNVGIGGAGGLVSNLASAGGIGDIISAGSSFFGGGAAAGGMGLAAMSQSAPIMSAAYAAPAIAGGAGIGSMIGAAMPYIGAAVLAYGLLGRGGGTPTSSTGDSKLSFSATGAMTGRGAMGDYVTMASDSADAFVKKMNEGYLAAAKNLGLTTAATTFAFAANTGGEDKQPMFGIGGGVVGGTYYDSAETVTSDAAQALEMSRALFTALQDSITSTAEYLRPAFAAINDIGAASQSDIDKALSFATALKVMRDELTYNPFERFTMNLNDSLKRLGTSAALFEADFLAAFGAGMSAADFSEWSTAYDLLNVQKQMELDTRKLEIGLMDAQGLTHMALVESRKLELDTMSATDAAIQRKIFRAQDEAKTQDLQIQLLMLTGKEVEAVRIQRLQELNGLSATDKILQMRIYRLQDEALALEKANAVAAERTSLEIRYANLQGDNTVARAAELKALDPTNRALQRSIWAFEDQQAAANAAAQSTQNMTSAYQSATSAQNDYLKGLISFGTNVRDFLLGLETNTGMGATPQGALKAAREQYLANLSGARGGDAEAYQRLTQSAQTYIEAQQRVSAGGGATSSVIAQIKSELGGLDAVTQLDANLAALKAIENAVNNVNTTTQSNVMAVRSVEQATRDIAVQRARDISLQAIDTMTSLRKVALGIEATEEVVRTANDYAFHLDKMTYDLTLYASAHRDRLDQIIAELQESRATNARLLEILNRSTADAGNKVVSAVLSSGAKQVSATTTAALLPATN